MPSIPVSELAALISDMMWREHTQQKYRRAMPLNGLHVFLYAVTIIVTLIQFAENDDMLLLKKSQMLSDRTILEVSQTVVSLDITISSFYNGNNDKIEAIIMIRKQNQWNNGPVNVHLISGPSIRTKQTKPG